MAETFIGEIRMFGGNYPPNLWAYCDGQSMSTSQSDVLFSLLSTTYGGDGVSTFNLPDLRGRLPMHFGNGPGLSQRHQGQMFGVENVQLSASQLPGHTHQMFSSPATTDNQADPTGRGTADGMMIYADVSSTSAATLAAESVESSGLGTKHTNMMPYLAVHFIIALVGEYPSRH
ncbi:MAG: tail fiber protein [Candidatus Thiodiazotropha sp. (ex Epidulcina cf. delphinae)]|nr:tail fiber protein [Candidatus Thiodiazotropha sp. (ex Epidulcina cf. delphinae)]